MALTADRVKRGPRQGLRTTCPRAMALRSVMTVISATCYFYAFRLLPFAEVFVFIGLVPLLAGLLSGPILGEHVRGPAWLALGAGFVWLAYRLWASEGTEMKRRARVLFTYSLSYLFVLFLALVADAGLAAMMGWM